MPTREQIRLRHSIRYTLEAACVHCDGFVFHESWCPEQNAAVRYAYQAVSQPHRLSLGDQLILHALGVVWTDDEIWQEQRSFTLHRR